jgi:hypothetical protein
LRRYAICSGGTPKCSASSLSGLCATAAVESVDLAAVEDRHGAEENPPWLVVGLGRGVSVTATRGHRRADPDGVLTLADAVAELEPALKPATKLA